MNTSLDACPLRVFGVAPRHSREPVRPASDWEGFSKPFGSFLLERCFQVHLRLNDYLPQAELAIVRLRRTR